MLSQKLVDLLKVVKPSLNIVDGVVGMEGYGPTRGGIPKEIGLIAAGKDPVAVDAVCSKIMGYDPMFIDTTRIADYEKELDGRTSFGCAFPRRGRAGAIHFGLLWRIQDESE